MTYSDDNMIEDVELFINHSPNAANFETFRAKLSVLIPDCE